jgi:hypothetical protein
MNNENPTLKKHRRIWPFRQQWFSLCSTHYNGKIGCNRCHAGQWLNTTGHFFGHWIYKLFPRLWRWWANRPNSSSRKFLEKHFPNLRK